MNPVNITIHIESTAKKRSMHGTIAFTERCDADEAACLLQSAGYIQVYPPDGFRRSLFQFDQQIGGKRYDFFIVDELIPPPPPPPPPSEDRRVG